MIIKTDCAHLGFLLDVDILIFVEAGETIRLEASVCPSGLILRFFWKRVCAGNPFAHALSVVWRILCIPVSYKDWQKHISRHSHNQSPTYCNDIHLILFS